MTIDRTIEFFNGLECHTPQAKDAKDVAVNTMRKYQMMQADYNARLKADMVAMLTELLLETEEMDCGIDHDFEGYYTGVVACQMCIQQKINALKGDSDGD